MDEQNPANDATGLYRLKAWFTQLLTPIINLAVRKGWSPDVFTVIGVLGGVLMSFGLSARLPFWVFIGLVVRLGGANLDGAVARARELPATAKGFLKNEVGDRLADWFALSAFLAFPGVSPLVVLFTMVVTSAPTMVSLVGVSRGQRRLNGGPVGKVERCVLLLVMSVLMFIGFDVADTSLIFLGILTAGSITTAIFRFWKISQR